MASFVSMEVMEQVGQYHTSMVATDYHALLLLKF